MTQKTVQNTKTFEEQAEFCLVAVAMGYFVFRLFYFAMYISPYVPPDEITHFGMCQVFSKSLFLPENSPQTYHLGVVGYSPYLYYLVMGKCLNLNFFPIFDLVFLRFLNCIISFITVLYGYKWIQLTTENRICRVMFVFLLTNTPMFTFLSACVSYDNLTNFFAVTALYYLHLFLKNHELTPLLLFVLSILGGTLTKLTFLPLALAYSGILIFREQKNLTVSVLKKYLMLLVPAQKALSVIIILFLCLNIMLYVGNLIRFKTLVPRLDQVITEANAVQSRTYARSKIVSRYKSGEITFQEAVEQARKIPHPGDRSSTFSLLERVRNNLSNLTSPMNRIQYIWLWLKIMLNRIVGIAGHIFLSKNGCWITAYQVIFLFSFLCFARFWHPATERYFTDVFIICIFYVLILMQYVNYPVYSQYMAAGFGVQGRYFFPVLVPFYGIVVHYLLVPFKIHIQILLFLMVSIFFIQGDFPYFLQHATSLWFFR